MLEIYRQPVMVEQFIDGDEVTVGMLGNSPAKVLGMMRILPRKQSNRFVYTVEVKRDWKNLVDYECPAHLKETTSEKINAYSLKPLRCWDAGIFPGLTSELALTAYRICWR